MEFGDIVYLILIVAFMIFGFFKEIRKKNRKIDESTEPVNTELGDLFRDVFDAGSTPHMPPATDIETKKKNKETGKSLASKEFVFQSSMDLVTDFEGESSLKGHGFKEHLNEESLNRATLVELHPVLDDLTGENRSEELQKAIVYSEIIKRKY